MTTLTATPGPSTPGRWCSDRFSEINVAANPGSGRGFRFLVSNPFAAPSTEGDVGRRHRSGPATPEHDSSGQFDRKRSWQELTRTPFLAGWISPDRKHTRTRTPKARTREHAHANAPVRHTFVVDSRSARNERMAACITLTPLLNADNTPADDPQLPTVHVTAVHINEDELCTGHACFGLFGPGTVTAPLPGEISLVDPEPESRPECEGDATSREGRVWAFYRAQLARMAVGSPWPTITMGRLDSDFKDSGGLLTISFSDGSRGVYLRSDSDLYGSHGFHEQEAPNCDG